MSGERINYNGFRLLQDGGEQAVGSTDDCCCCSETPCDVCAIEGRYIQATIAGEGTCTDFEGTYEPESYHDNTTWLDAIGEDENFCLWTWHKEGEGDSWYQINLRWDKTLGIYEYLVQTGSLLGGVGRYWWFGGPATDYDCVPYSSCTFWQGWAEGEACCLPSVTPQPWQGLFRVGDTVVLDGQENPCEVEECPSWGEWSSCSGQTLTLTFLEAAP